MAVRLLQRGLDAQLVVHQQLQSLRKVSVQLLHLCGAAAPQLLLLRLYRPTRQSAIAASKKTVFLDLLRQIYQTTSLDSRSQTACELWTVWPTALTQRWL